MGLPSRRSIRLKDYDYAQGGMYFITICTHHKKCLFGTITDGKMILNSVGQLVAHEWQKTAIIRNDILIDIFVVMPNHLHGIIILNSNDVNAEKQGVCNTPLPNGNSAKKRRLISPSHTIGAIIRGFKGAVTRQANLQSPTLFNSLWQRNYYEHIIRNEKELEKIQDYIFKNPGNWENDTLFPATTKSIFSWH